MNCLAQSTYGTREKLTVADKNLKLLIENIRIPILEHHSSTTTLL